MKKILKIIRNIILAVLAFLGIVFVVLFIYYFPVIDRVYLRTCEYYPNMFIDCQ